MNNDSSYPAFSCISSVVCPRRCLPPGRCLALKKCSNLVLCGSSLARPTAPKKNLFAPSRHPSFDALHFVLLIVYRSICCKNSQTSPTLIVPLLLLLNVLGLAGTCSASHCPPSHFWKPDQNYPVLRALHCLVAGRQWPSLPSVLYNSDTHVSFARAHHSHSKI